MFRVERPEDPWFEASKILIISDKDPGCFRGLGFRDRILTFFGKDPNYS